MWNVVVALSPIPPAVPLLDASDPLRVIAVGVAAAAVAGLCCLAGMAQLADLRQRGNLDRRRLSPSSAGAWRPAPLPPRGASRSRLRSLRSVAG